MSCICSECTAKQSDGCTVQQQCLPPRLNCLSFPPTAQESSPAGARRSLGLLHSTYRYWGIRLPRMGVIEQDATHSDFVVRLVRAHTLYGTAQRSAQAARTG